MIERIREKIDVSNPGIVHLWRRNQNVVRHNRLHGSGRVEVGSHHHLSPIAIERGVKSGIAVVRRIENEIEHHEPRAGGEEPVEEQGPNFARPRKRPLTHELERAVARQFAWFEGRQLQRALIDPEKNEVVAGRRLAALALQKILEAFLARPDGGNERHVRVEMQQQHETRPEERDRGENQQSMAPKPMHEGIIGRLPSAANSKLLRTGPSPPTSGLACPLVRAPVSCSAPCIAAQKLAEKRFEQLRFRLTIALRCAGRSGILVHLVLARKSRPNQRMRSGRA